MKETKKSMIEKAKRKAVIIADSNTDFEVALNSGCYQFDFDAVKEKHLEYMLQCFSAQQADLINPLDALNIYLQKHIEY